MTLAQRASVVPALAKAEPVLAGGTVTALLTTVLALWHPGAGVTGILVPLVSLVVATLIRSRVSPGTALPGRLPVRYGWEEVPPASTITARPHTTNQHGSNSMGFLDEFRTFIENHAPGLEHDASVAAAVATDALTSAAHAATNLTAQMRQDFADLIAKADAEIARVVEEATANGHAAGVQSTQPAPEQPAEGEQPPV